MDKDKLMDTNDLKYIQKGMHKDLFDRLNIALSNEFYFEAITLEYAAIEGRLEVIMGVLGCPCNKDLDVNKRKDIKIYHRITCLKKLCNIHPLLGKSKITKTFLEQVDAWRKQRNIYIHGLYKNALKYDERNVEMKDVAEKGFKLVKDLYSEAKKLRPKRYCYQYSGNTCFHNGCICNAFKGGK